MGDSPAISVVVLNYNYGRFLAECIRSILAQTSADFELIVIDDCSKDDSVDVVKPFLSDARVRLEAHQKNLGFTGSIIQGTEELSRGEFVIVVSADDLVMRNDAFETQLRLMRANPTAALCFSAYEFVKTGADERTHRSHPAETVLERAEAFRSLVVAQGVWPLHSGTMVRKSAYDATEGYRRDIKYPLDLALWLDLLLVGGYAYTPLPLYGYREHGTQMSRGTARHNTRETAMVIREACEKGEALGLGTAKLAREAVASHLAAYAVHEAFSGNVGVARARFWAALMECPSETLTSRKLWIAGARAYLGERVYSVGRKVARAPVNALRRFGRSPAA